MLTPPVAGLVLLLTLQAPAVPPPAPGPAYAIGPGDVLAIRVLDELDLSRDYSVDADGTITFPFLNRLVVGGKTVKQVESDLIAGLMPAYLRNPQVAVTIAQYRSRFIFVWGEVRIPAKYSIEGPISLQEVIAKAGSLTPTAGDELRVLRAKDGAALNAPANPDDQQTVVVLRVRLSDLTEGRVQSNIWLQDGDTLYVPAADRFFVGGFVNTPGSYVLLPNMTVRQALAVAGGLTDRGSDRGMTITRVVKGKEVKIDARMDTRLQPGDTLHFRQRRF